MEFNILDMFKNAVGNQLIDQASGFLGESKDGTSKALGALLPGILGGLVNKGGSESGAQGILDFLTKNNVDGGMLGNLAGMFSGGDNTNGLLEKGGGMLDFIFGKGSNTTSNLLDMVTSIAGIKRGSSNSLLRMATPLLMGVIGKHVKSKALGALGLKNLLASQVPALKKSAPAGLFDKLGFGSALDSIGGLIGDASSAVTGAAAGAAAAGSKLASNVSHSAKKVGNTAASAAGSAAKAGANTVSGAAKATKSGLNRWLPLLLLAALAIAAFAIMRSCGKNVGDMASDAANKAKEATENVADKAGEMAEKTADAAGNMAEKAAGAVTGAAKQAGAVIAGLGAAAVEAAKKLGKTVENGIASFTLPGGKKISTPEGSASEAFLTFLAANGSDMGTRFTLDRVNFQTGSANITEESKEQLMNFASILDAYKNVNIRCEGHTDNTGNADSNKNLSQQRAMSIKSFLAQHGVASSRIEAVGFGQEKPIADNATEEGRADNRRVDIFVTKK